MKTQTSAFAIDHAVCELARLARDARFDGLFFTAVTSTGIYCRPVCPAPTPKPKNVTYFANAAAAAAAGFRPCLRCRPELAPGSPSHRAGSELVAAALRMIEDGALDDSSVAALAARVGVGERHLRRLFVEQLGASPLDVAATRRVLFAKQLIGETALPMTEVAAAAGYRSLRRFNSAMQSVYGVAPRELRRRDIPATGSDELVLRLPYREPYDFSGLLEFFARRAIPGVESIAEGCYRRVFSLRDAIGCYSVRALAKESALELRVRHPHPAALLEIVTRVRRQFDLDAMPHVIAARFRRSVLLRPMLRRHAGVRVPGCWDGFEIAVRAILGQQVSVAAARTLASRIVDTFGERIDPPIADGSRALFPTPHALLNADLESLGITRARAATIRRAAVAVIAGEVHFRPEQTLADFVRAWTQIPGIGEWTAHYIALRALGKPDAFPAADLVLRRVAGNGSALSTKELDQLSAEWSPWRAYAVMLLWRSAA